MGFEPHQFRYVVFLREAGDLLAFVLGDSFGEVAGYAYVEDAGFAGH